MPKLDENIKLDICPRGTTTSPQYGWGRLFFQNWFRRGPLRAGHGIPSSTECISEYRRRGLHFPNPSHVLASDCWERRGCFFGARCLALFQWPYNGSGNMDSSLRNLFVQTVFLFLFGWLFFGGLPSHFSAERNCPEKLITFQNETWYENAPKSHRNQGSALFSCLIYITGTCQHFLTANFKHAICFFHRRESAGIATLSFGRMRLTVLGNIDMQSLLL